MSVIKVEKNRNYTVLNNEFLRNKELSLKSKGLLAMILSLPEEWTYSINGLVAICKESITSVRSSLKELEQHGYVVITKKQDAKGRFIYDYTIYETLEMRKNQPDPCFIQVDNAPLDNQVMESAEMENVNLLNKDVLSKEKEITNDLFIYIKEQAPAPLWSLLNDYLEMKKEKGTPLNLRSLKMLLNRLEKLSNNNINIERLMLENAIQNGWANVYRPKDQEIEAAGKALKNELKSFYGI